VERELLSQGEILDAAIMKLLAPSSQSKRRASLVEENADEPMLVA
jgi:hypothetical protein